MTGVPKTQAYDRGTMADLFVDLNSMNGLYNQLGRASDNSSDTLDHVRTHSDLEPWEAGFLAQLMTPHNRAYERVVGAITTFRAVTRDAATQVNQAQVRYSQTDHEAAVAIDRAYPGAADPIGLRGERFSSPPSSDDSRVLFADDVDPTQFLRPPEYVTELEMWDVNPLADLVSPAAWLRQAAIWAIGTDPFENWVIQLSGNWKAYLHAGLAIGQAGGVIGDVGRNMLSGARDVPEAWRGNAADGFQEFQFSLARTMVEFEDVCGEYSKLYVEASSAVKRLTDAAAGLLMKFIDALIYVSGALAAGTATIETVLGPIAGYSTAAYYAWQAYNLYKEISFVYGTAEDSIKFISGSVDAISASAGLGETPSIQPYHHPASG